MLYTDYILYNRLILGGKTVLRLLFYCMQDQNKFVVIFINNAVLNIPITHLVSNKNMRQFGVALEIYNPFYER